MISSARLLQVSITQSGCDSMAASATLATRPPKGSPLYRCDRVSHEVLVQEDVDLARWQIGRALAQVIHQPLAMFRPRFTGKLSYPQVGGEARVRVEGGNCRFEGESSASMSFGKVPDPARQPDLPAFQREPTLSDQKRGFSITLLPQGLGHGESLLRCPQVL